MTGVIVEYLLGLYFIGISLSWENGKFVADAVKLIFGVLLLILAVLGISFAK
jgi:hypothetical protein